MIHRVAYACTLACRYPSKKRHTVQVVGINPAGFFDANFASAWCAECGCYLLLGLDELTGPALWLARELLADQERRWNGWLKKQRRKLRRLVK